ncbi:hypothetical protein Pelo_10274 [Pelomyxa schiedti]|nr:hypothetical protein Pelo_10274 [Pelomyxa schiedti]
MSDAKARAAAVLEQAKRDREEALRRKQHREHQERTEKSGAGGTTKGARLGNRLYITHVPPLPPAPPSGDPPVATADKYHFILLFPEAPGDVVEGRRLEGTQNIWNVDIPTEDLSFTQKVMDEVMFSYPVDLTKVFACGFSTGALFVTNAIVKFCDCWVAGANVMGGMVKRRGSIMPREATQTIPFKIFAAPEDIMLSSCELASNVFRDSGWQVQLQILPRQEKHTWPTGIEEEIWTWFQESTAPPPPPSTPTTTTTTTSQSSTTTTVTPSKPSTPAPKPDPEPEPEHKESTSATRRHHHHSKKTTKS